MTNTNYNPSAETPGSAGFRPNSQLMQFHGSHPYTALVISISLFYNDSIAA